MVRPTQGMRRIAGAQPLYSTMKKEIFDNVTLFNGESLTILSEMPADSVDAILTDPPYSSGGMSMSARQADPTSKYQSSGCKKHYPPMLGDAKDQRSWTMWCTLWLVQCWRVARSGAPLMVFTDWRQLPALTDAVQGAGLEMAGHRALGQAERPTANRQVPPAVRVRPLRLQGQSDPRNARLSAGPVFLPRHRQAEGASDKQARCPHS